MTGIGIIISAIGLGLIIVGHLCTTVWWMSKIATTLTRLSQDVREAVQDIKGLVPKSYCEKAHDSMEKKFDDVWKAIDDLRKK